MSKHVAMIPVRTGSKRVKNKNLRLIAGKPLIEYILESVIKSGKFNKEDIYINSESDTFLPIAKKHGVKFYQRPAWYASDEATNDDFLLEFLENVECDVVFQFLATSPFVKPEEISQFVDKMVDDQLDTLISVTPNKIECVYKGQPINFSAQEKTPPSQLLEPVYAYACGLMAWRRENFIKNMKTFSSAYHGGEGAKGFFKLKGFSTVDIDTEDDFALAVAVSDTLRSTFTSEPEYYDPKLHDNTISESHVPSIVRDDGVDHSDYTEANQPVQNLEAILNSKKNESWIHRVIDSENNSACLICQRPGEGNRRHYHPNWNEWWYIIQGTWDFEINGEIKPVKQGDFVFIPKNAWHKITATGDRPAIRLAVSREGVEHVYRLKEMSEA